MTFRDCPTSMEAIRALLSLGVKSAEISTLVFTNPACYSGPHDWYLCSYVNDFYCT